MIQTPYRVTAKMSPRTRQAELRVKWGEARRLFAGYDEYGNAVYTIVKRFLVQKKRTWILCWNWKTIAYFEKEADAIQYAQNAALRFEKFGDEFIYWDDTEINYE